MYLSRGLAMYESLRAHTTDFHLFIFAFDDLTYEILRMLELPDVTVVSLSEFETPALLEVKQSRSKGEYCWTCTPSAISYVILNKKQPNCTYLDADLIFYSDPAELITEMVECGKNVLITEHRFSTLSKLYELKRAGRFCVQFVTFTNENDSLRVLEKWRQQCIEWCFSRHEDGKFGDQKYLDEWPSLYENIHILNNLGGGVAPWNLQKYSFKTLDKSIIGREKNSNLKFRVVFFHFQYVKFIHENQYDIGWYWITSDAMRIFYLTYLHKVEEKEKHLLASYPDYTTPYTNVTFSSAEKPYSFLRFNLIKAILKKVIGYNIINL